MKQDTNSSDLLLACFQKALGHELPNLLVAGQGLARLLLLDTNEPEPRELLERLAQSLQKTDSLVRRLAALGRLLREPIHRQSVPVHEVVEEVAAELRSTRGLVPVRPRLGPLPNLQTDRERLRQILLAVLRNAAQASRPDVALEVQIEWSEYLNAMTVTDNGCGLPNRPVDTLLQPFASGATGQGLGLFTAGLLLRSLGGWLELLRLERGTQVRLYLPDLEEVPEAQL